LHVERLDAPPLTTLQPPGSAPLLLGTPAPSVDGHARLREAQPWRSLVAVGLLHLAEGIDHLLFLLGLVLLVPRLGRALTVLTAFTIGHGLSLAWALGAGRSVPAAPVELLIAWSLVLLAQEVSRRAPSAQPSSDGPHAPPPGTLLGRAPHLACLLLGLVHGLGFAGALRALISDERSLPRILLGFHLGIELGQLLFVLGCWGVALGLARLSRPALEAQLRRGAAYVIGCIGVYLLCDRALPLFAR
jgi:hypothetical protein